MRIIIILIFQSITIMISCHLMGGLGNQLFEIYTTLSYAIQHHMKFNFLNVQKLGNRFTFWDSFFLRLRPFLIHSFSSNMKIYREKDFTYEEIPKKNDCMLYGYFQSYKYFDEHKEKINTMIGIEKMKTTLLKKIGKSQEELKESISIHFRLGDYKHIQHCHPILPYMYYKNALKQFSYTQRNVYYFCEEEDKEHVEHIIQQLRKDYTECMFVSVGFELCDWEQLIYMSCCNHNIIANSSFSWWGAYLNEHNDKIVCYPSVWFGQSLVKDLKDLFLSNWIKIDCK